jgi:molybdenum cofactor synthesis domain-containing protein
MAGHAVVITAGGTGLNPRDHTPEQTRAVIEREIPQLAAAIARYGIDHGVPTAVLSRGLVGVADRTLIINLPGSSGGARDGMAVLAPILEHAISQIRGGDH